MRILVTGATGVVGTEVCRLLAVHGEHDVVRVARRKRDESPCVIWRMGAEPPPEALRRPWDIIIHTAASTRWTMTAAEAEQANTEPTEAVLELTAPETHFVHVSTAYVERNSSDGMTPASTFGGYRNGYEWSKARCEELVRAHSRGPVSMIRLPLVLGRRTDGVIARFSGPYTMVQALVSGLAATLVGDQNSYAEIAPVDQVAEAIVETSLAPPSHSPRTGVVSGGRNCLTLGKMTSIMTDTLNDWRAQRRIPPIDRPPLVSSDSWHRFYMPLAEQYLSPMQHHAVQLLAMFESYTSMATPFTPTWTVQDPGDVLARSVLYWADEKPRLAARIPEPWALIAQSVS